MLVLDEIQIEDATTPEDPQEVLPSSPTSSHDIKIYDCSFCDFGMFPTKEGIEEHVRIKHPKESRPRSKFVPSQAQIKPSAAGANQGPTSSLSTAEPDQHQEQEDEIEIPELAMEVEVATDAEPSTSTQHDNDAPPVLSPFWAIPPTAAPTAPISPIVQTRYDCGLCQTSLANKQTWLVHLKSKKHMRRSCPQSLITDELPVPIARKERAPRGSYPPNYWQSPVTCEVCNVTVGRAVNLIKHLDSRDHKLKDAIAAKDWDRLNAIMGSARKPGRPRKVDGGSFDVGVGGSYGNGCQSQDSLPKRRLGRPRKIVVPTLVVARDSNAGM